MIKSRLTKPFIKTAGLIILPIVFFAFLFPSCKKTENFTGYSAHEIDFEKNSLKLKRLLHRKLQL